jgi:hypothetical protein
LDIVYALTVPDRPENYVGKPQNHQVLDHLLAEIVIDAINLSNVFVVMYSWCSNERLVSLFARPLPHFQQCYLNIKRNHRKKERKMEMNKQVGRNFRDRKDKRKKGNSPQWREKPGKSIP